MIQSAALLKDLKAQLKLVQADLRSRADDQDDRWGARLQEEYAEARKRERTGHSWVVWRDNEVDQAAVAWLIAMTFVRFCEDNDLLSGARINGQPVAVGWIAGPGDRTARAEENLTAYFRENPTHNRRDWLRQAFRVLAAQPAGRALVDQQHNPVWIADISAERASALIDFWRQADGAGELVHDFTDPSLDTRFLGDLYQDLSEHARKTYALLQTPVFIEEFILDQTLTPALAEFGLSGIKLIDPTCGSGHFLLGAFQRLVNQWETDAPALDARERVRRAMDSIHGVDLNPFAVAIARFRLTVAGLLAMGERSLVGVPSLGFHLAIGDSLLGSIGGGIDVIPGIDGNESEPSFTYNSEDLKDYVGILRGGQYHVVVGNPPYIQVNDPALNDLYRASFKTAFREYALSVPFLELLFQLAVRGEQGVSAGYVGQITSNSFMKREYGKKLIEELFGGHYLGNPVDLTAALDTSGAYIPGHGTPTVILIGRRRRPVADTVHAVIGTRGEPGVPDDASTGRVWTEIVEHFGEARFDGDYVQVADLPRARFSSYPWVLSGGVAFETIDGGNDRRLSSAVRTFGYTGQTNADGVFVAPRDALERRAVEPDLIREFVTGDSVRDYIIDAEDASIFPYGEAGLVEVSKFPGLYRWMWPARESTWSRATFAKKTYKAEGRPWWEWHQVALGRVGGLSITSAFVSTHPHFALDRDGRVFNRHAPMMKLTATATEDDHLALLGVLNSSTACFWLKQVAHNKGSTVDTKGARQTQAAWEDFYEFSGTKLEQFPLPAVLPTERGRRLDLLAQRLSESGPKAVIDAWASEGPAGHTLGDALAGAGARWAAARARMVFEQEELDWEVYRQYGLLSQDLTYQGTSLDQIELGERAFEIVLAGSSEQDPAWFLRHGSSPITELPLSWPDDYRELVGRRIDLINSEPSVRLLEKPEFKRRWAATAWEVRVGVALRTAILDRLEAADLWRDGQGPSTRSIGELADAVKGDSVVRELVAVLTGDSEADLAKVLASLVMDEAVPYLAAHRYKAAGLEKFRTWQQVWDLQRREDAGEVVDIPTPPKYSTPDFRKAEYWKARGKLDVPKERFILYPGLGREGDSTIVLGWAGWDHRDQALALAREFPVQDALGAGDDLLTQMVAGLVELEPWLHQWHSEMDASFGVSPAEAISGVIDQQLGRLASTRDEVTSWEPPAPTRGRRAKIS